MPQSGRQRSRRSSAFLSLPAKQGGCTRKARPGGAAAIEATPHDCSLPLAATLPLRGLCTRSRSFEPSSTMFLCRRTGFCAERLTCQNRLLTPDHVLQRILVRACAFPLVLVW